MKKTILLLLLSAAPLFGAASILFTSPVVSADGRTVTATATGFSGSLSPTSGITNIQIYDVYRGGYISTSGTGVTISGSTLTVLIPATQPPASNNVAAVQLVVNSGSNLTDTASNTVATQVTNANIAASEVYVPTLAPFSTAAMTEASWVDGSADKGALSLASTGACPGFVVNVTGIALRVFQYGGTVGHHWVLYQADAGNPGTVVNDWGTTANTTSSIDLAPITGLSGMHLYRLCDVSSQADYSSIGVIRLIGLVGFGTAPSRRPIMLFAGDSLRANELVPDLRLGDGWQLANLFGAVYQHSGASGNTIGTEIVAAVPAIMTKFSGSEVLSVLNCCWSSGLNDVVNDHVDAATLAARWTTLLNAISGTGRSFSHVLTLGIAPTSLYSTVPGTYDPTVSAAIAANSLPSTYVHTSTVVPNWVNNTVGDGSCTLGGGDKQSDNLHLQGCLMSTLVGYGKVAAREVPLYDRLLNGHSYSTSCAGTGTVGVAQTCTISKFGNSPWTGDEVITPSSSGGTFSPSGAITPAAGATAPTFTFTPTSAGTKTIAYSNGQEGWLNPSNSSITVASGITATWIVP